MDVLLLPSIPGLPSCADVAADPVAVNTRLGTYTFVNLLDCCALTVPVRRCWHRFNYFNCSGLERRSPCLTRRRIAQKLAESVGKELGTVSQHTPRVDAPDSLPLAFCRAP